MASETLLTVEDAMRVLRLSRISIYRAISSGRLRALKPGGLGGWRIRPAELENFIQGGRRTRRTTTGSGSQRNRAGDCQKGIE